MNSQMKPSEILSKALEVWGPKGEHWCQGSFTEDDKFCLYGGMAKACGANMYPEVLYDSHKNYYHASEIVQDILFRKYSHTNGSIISFNDSHTTSFKDVKTLVCEAIKVALKEEEPKDENK